MNGGPIIDLVKWEPFNGLDRIQSRINEFFANRDGILEIDVPKADETKPKQNAISVN
jgi:HSP20 family molecular chaperone IbpA